MSVKLLVSSATFSTSDGSWLRSEAYNMALYTKNIYYTNIATTPTLISLIFSNACNALGVCLFFYRATVNTTTVTVTLQENTGTWVDRANKTINIDNDLITFDPIINYGQYSGVYIPFTSSYPVTTGVNIWRLSIVAGTSLRVSLLRNQTAGNYFYAVMGDLNSNKPTTTSDQFIIDKDVTLTLDSNYTAPADSQCNISIILNHNSWLKQLEGTILSLAGTITCGSKWKYSCGSSDNRIPASNKAILITTNNTSTYGIFELPVSLYTGNYNGIIEMYGEIDDYLTLDVTSTASSGQKYINVSADYSAIWSAGNIIRFVGKNSSSDSVEYTIDSITSTTIKVTVNLDYNVIKGARVVNLTRSQNNLGIQIKNTGDAVITFINTNPTRASLNYTVMDGIYCEKLMIALFENHWSSTAISQYKNIIIYFNTGNNSNYTVSSTISGLGGTVIENYHSFQENINKNKFEDFKIKIKPILIEICKRFLDK